MDAEERFRYYYGEYYARMLQIAGLNGIPEDETEDLLQETFLSFYIHYSCGDHDKVPEGNVKSLLSRIMKNRCIDYWRKKENRILEAVNPDRLTEVLNEQAGMAGRDTLDIVLENQFFDDLKNAVVMMRNEWKMVYVPYELLGRPMEEISEMLGISEGACRMRNSRGKRYLADYMRERQRDMSC